MRALALSLCVLAIGCAGVPTPREEDPSMRLRESGWSDENRARLERIVDELGSRSGRRVAVFDWDNTMIRGDVGDLVLAHLIEHRGVAVHSDASVYALLTDEARALVTTECASPGDACDRVLAHLAWNGTLPDQQEPLIDRRPGFTTPMLPSYRATYGFLAQLVTAQRTDEQLRAIMLDVWPEAARAPIGARSTIGGVEVERFLRLNLPMVELTHALEREGVEVWIVSASPQAIVEVAAEHAGIPRDRVIGVRMQHDEHGTAMPGFEWEEDGQPITSWYVGKRRWIERVIGARPVFAAGDSDGDLAMLEDAGFRLVLDRHPVRVMCSALSDPDHWIVQTLFHDPPPPRTEPYPCATFRDALGPVVDRDGRPIPDQGPVDARDRS